MKCYESSVSPTMVVVVVVVENDETFVETEAGHSQGRDRRKFNALKPDKLLWELHG